MIWGFDPPKHIRKPTAVAGLRIWNGFCDLRAVTKSPRLRDLGGAARLAGVTEREREKTASAGLRSGADLKEADAF